MLRQQLLHYLTTFTLAPILIRQGKQARAQTIRLPEPAGERQGTQGDGPPLRLLVLGDSAAAGVGAQSQSEALSGQLVAALQNEFCVEWHVVAKTGWRTHDAIRAVEALPVQPFDLVVTSLGVNDVTASVPLSHWLHLQRSLLHKLRTTCSPQRVLISAVPPMQTFTALPQPLRWYMGQRAAQFNRALKAWTEHEAGCQLVEHQGPLSKAHIASDGFHPSPAAYAIWAQHLKAAYRSQQA